MKEKHSLSKEKRGVQIAFFLVLLSALVWLNLAYKTRGKEVLASEASTKERISETLNQVNPADYSPNKIIVKYKNEVDSNFFSPQRADVLKRSGILNKGQQATTVNPPSNSPFHNTYVVDLRTTDTFKAKNAVTKLNNNPYVEYAEPDLKMRTKFLPNDPKLSDGTQWDLTKVNAPGGWDVTHGNPQVTAAVVDTGIDKSHPDLINKVGNTTSDCNGHGTHVAGIIAAETNNGIGIAGGGFNTHLEGYSPLDCNGDGFISDIAAAVTQAVQAGASTINLSLGGMGYSQTLCSAIDDAYNHNVVVLVAAGNDNTNIAPAPANCNDGFGKTELLNVASTDQNDVKSDFSNYGSWVSVSAPGSDIYSTMASPDNLGCNSDYCTLSGTSMAAPHVTALASLVKAVCPNKIADEIFTLIISNTDNIDSQNPVFIGALGSGRINFAKTLQAAATLCSAPTLTPTPSPTLTVSPTATPTPTITPIPTATPLPSATPIPTATPTTAPTPTPTPLMNCSNADLNNSGKVDDSDVGILQSKWGTSQDDLSGDKIVNAIDLTLLISCWSKS